MLSRRILGRGSETSILLSSETVKMQPSMKGKSHHFQGYV